MPRLHPEEMGWKYSVEEGRKEEEGEGSRRKEGGRREGEAIDDDGSMN